MPQEQTTPQCNYDAQARKHAPKTDEEFHAAVRSLIDGGATEYDVAAALRIGVQQVRRVIGRRNCE